MKIIKIGICIFLFACMIAWWKIESLLQKKNKDKEELQNEQAARERIAKIVDDITKQSENKYSYTQLVAGITILCSEISAIEKEKQFRNALGLNVSGGLTNTSYDGLRLTVYLSVFFYCKLSPYFFIHASASL